MEEKSVTKEYKKTANPCGCTHTHGTLNNSYKNIMCVLFLMFACNNKIKKLKK